MGIMDYSNLSCLLGHNASITMEQIQNMSQDELWKQSTTPMMKQQQEYQKEAPKPEVKPQRRKTMLENVKGYIEKHKDILFTLGLVILVDHFLFKGALRNKIQATLEGVLKKAENMIQKEGE